MTSNPNYRKNRARGICISALIATLYVILTLASAILGLDRGVIQLRLSETLCILAVFTPTAVSGVTVGCLLANILCGAAGYDILFGTLATLLGMLLTRALHRLPYLAPLPYVLSNTLIIPLVLRYAYGTAALLPFLFLSIGIGELICGYICGILLYLILKRTKLSKMLV